jgi:hypothetical protein
MVSCYALESGELMANTIFLCVHIQTALDIAVSEQRLEAMAVLRSKVWGCSSVSPLQITTSNSFIHLQ